MSVFPEGGTTQSQGLYRSAHGQHPAADGQLYGKHRHPCRSFLGAERHKAKVCSVPLMGGILPPTADGVMGDAPSTVLLVLSRPLLAFAEATRLTSDGVPVPSSALWKQPQPGGRNRRVRAVSGGHDGRRERPARGHGHPGANGCCPKAPTSMAVFPWGGILLSAGSSVVVTCCR